MSEIPDANPDSYMTGDFENIHELQGDIRTEDTKEEVELTSEEKEKIARAVAIIRDEFNKAIELLDSDHHWTTNLNDGVDRINYQSFLFNGNPKTATYVSNPYIFPVINGMTIPLPISKGEGFYTHFFSRLLPTYSEIGELLPEAIIQQIESLREKTNQKAAELIRENEEIDDLWVCYRYVVDQSYSRSALQDEYFSNMMKNDRDKLLGLREKYPSHQIDRAIGPIRDELELKIRPIETELLRSDRSIVEEYHQIIEQLERLASK